MQTRLCNSNNFEKDTLEKNNNIIVCDENLLNTMLQNQDLNFQDWWQICQYICLSCKAKNVIEQSAVKACYKEYDEVHHCSKTYVVQQM